MKTEQLQKKKKQLCPTLRFPGFIDKWEEKDLGEILKERKEYSTKGKGYTHISLTTKGVIPKSERYDRDFLVGNDEIKGYKITQLNDLCYNPANLKFGVISINKLGAGIFSPIYITFEIIGQNIDFVGYYLIRDAFITKARRYEQGTVYERMAVHPSDFVKVKVKFPSLPEQQKISSFLSSIDNWLENLYVQQENLQQYKKGLMQKIFSQEIRFKDDKGNDFPKWEEKKLWEICNIKKGEQLNKISLSENSGYPVINGGKELSGYTRTYNTKANTITISEGGNSCGFVNFIKENFWSGGHCYVILNIVDNLDLIYMYQYLKFLEKNIMKLRVGSGLPNIQKKDIEQLKIIFPLLSEQQKIAGFLTSVDNLLSLKQQQITQAEQWKKGLIQNLFI